MKNRGWISGFLLESMLFSHASFSVAVTVCISFTTNANVSLFNLSMRQPLAQLYYTYVAKKWREDTSITKNSPFNVFYLLISLNWVKCEQNFLTNPVILRKKTFQCHILWYINTSNWNIFNAAILKLCCRCRTTQYNYIWPYS